MPVLYPNLQALVGKTTFTSSRSFTLLCPNCVFCGISMEIHVLDESQTEVIISHYLLKTIFIMLSLLFFFRDCDDTVLFDHEDQPPVSQENGQQVLPWSMFRSLGHEEYERTAPWMRRHSSPKPNRYFKNCLTNQM